MARSRASGGGASAAGGGGADKDPIKHVIVLMLENRSFDQMLGALQKVYPDLDGAEAGGPPRVNVDPEGNRVAQMPRADRKMKGDPKHELPNALNQLSDDMGNFVKDYASAYPSSDRHEWEQVMAYFPPDALPALHRLAREFRVCDRWFSSVPGATWPNRLFFHSGTSIGRAKMPQGPFDLSRHRYDQDTLYDRLNTRGIAWKIYYGDFPQSMLLEHQWRPQNAKRYRPMEEFYRDAAGPDYKFPSYCFIEPRYYAPQQNDDHPPHDVMGAQRLLADVYNALRANESLWQSSLLVVLYDEHGGFYDHVPPPATVAPDEHRDDYSFDRLGVRVPAVLVSPWVERGVDHTVFDHTSFLKYLIEKWQLQPLGERAARANSLAAALRLAGAPREDTPPRVEVPEASAAEKAAEAAAATELNELQTAMVALAMYLAKMTPGDPKEKLRQLEGMMENPAGQVQFATDAIRRFVEHAEGGGAGVGAHGRDSGGGAGPAAARGPGDGKVIDKGHRGVGGQGRSHRKKVSVKKVRHEKFGRGGSTKPSV
jgi:phospholipase C